ncbi:coil containing protein [Vibrio phage 1.174.O._10N.261.55.A8]|nr:coil containing protein [Vibrio phage 1.174.O._10N.261.55.A8]
MGMTVTNINLHGVTVECANAETLTLAVTAAETLAEGLILGEVTADGSGGFYARGASNGLEVARYVLLSQVVVTAADVTAGTKNVRVMQGGKVRQDKLSIKAGGTIDYREVSGLKDNSILALNTTDYSVLDNQ